MKLRYVLLCLLLATPTYAQRLATIFNNYDLDVTAYTYCDSANIPTEIPVCVTTAQAVTDGWMSVSNDARKTFQISIDQIVVTGGIDITVEGKVTGSTSIVTIWTDNVTTATTDNDIVTVPEDVNQLRIGIKIGTADDGNDLTTNLEIIDIQYVGGRARR